MCAPCEASKARLEAAQSLRLTVEQSMLSEALKKAFPAQPLPDEVWTLLRKF